MKPKLTSMLVEHVVGYDASIGYPAEGKRRYIMTADGVDLQAANKVYQATVECARAVSPILGVPDAQPKLEIVPTRGKINGRFIDAAYRIMERTPTLEVNLQIAWSAATGYQLVYNQLGTESAVKDYIDVPGVIAIDIHSHGRNPAYFSETDIVHAKNFRAYMVIGHIGIEPTCVLMLGVYGSLHHLRAEDIFDPLPKLVEVWQPNVVTGRLYEQ